MKKIFGIIMLLVAVAMGSRCAAQDDYYYAINGGVTFTGTQWNASTKGSNVTLTNFNLTAAESIGNGSAVSSVSHTGACYFEFTYSSGSTYGVGIANSSFVTSNNVAGTVNSWVYVMFSGAGNKQNGISGSAYGATWTTGDVISVYYNGSGSLTFYKNGVSQGVAFTGISGAVYAVIGTYSSFAFTGTAAFAAPWDSRTATIRSSLSIGTTGW